MALIGTYQATVDLVREFHQTFGHPVAKELTVATAKLRALRVRLIADELAELCQAMGVSLEMEVKPARIGADTMENVSNGMFQNVWVAEPAMCYADEMVDMVETADALGDIDVVVAGANLVFGIPAGLVAREIFDSNMSKLGADGKPIYREDGKIMKGPNFREPDIAKILDEFDRELEL